MRRLLAFLVLSAATAGLAPAVASAQAASSSSTLATTNLGYTPLASPVRIADTRKGATDPSTYAGMTLAEGTSLTIDIPSSADVPATAGAVVVNITAIDPAAAGFLAVYPGGSTNPGTANVTFTAGQTVGNLVTVGLGPDATTSATQSFTVYNGPSSNGGNVDFTADLEGYYAPQTSSSGAPYVGITPTRIYDTRTGSGQTGAGSTLTNGGSANVTVTGVANVPTTASAVVLNVALTNATVGTSSAPNFIYAYPTGSAPTTPVANQTYVAGETLSSQVIVGVGTNGAVTIANHAGDVDIVIDVEGYFAAAGASGALFNALASPTRLLDTRPNTVAGGGTTSVTVQGTGATAGVLNVTDIYEGTSGGNFLTAYPTGATAPTAATVNYVTGDTYDIVPNATYATVGTSAGVTILNGPSNAGAAAVVVDEFGYFATPAAAVSFTVSPSTAQSPVVSTTTTTTNGQVSYTASGIPSGDTVSLALFPSTGADAPTVSSTGAVTFTPTTASTAGAAAGQGTTDNGKAGSGAFVDTLNGAPLGTEAAGNTHTGAPGKNGKMTGIVPSSGSVTFTLNSFVADGAVPVVWSEPSSATADTLMVNADGTPQSGFSVGIGGAATWSLYGTFSVSPSTAQTPTASTTGKGNTVGDVNYTVSGIPAADTVSVALFPATGPDAPTVSSTGAITFAPTTPSTEGPAAGQGTTDNGAAGLGGFVESINGASLGNAPGNTHTGAPGVNGKLTGVAPDSNGDVTFTINSFSADGTIPVVWFEPTGATADTLSVNADGTPQDGFIVGVGGSTTWSTPG